MGKRYDPGVKLTKAEKTQRESEAKLKKLKMMDTKGEQEKDKEDATNTLDTGRTTMDTSNMPQLISSDDDKTSRGEARRKRFVSKKPPHWKHRGK